MKNGPFIAASLWKATQNRFNSFRWCLVDGSLSWFLAYDGLNRPGQQLQWIHSRPHFSPVTLLEWWKAGHLSAPEPAPDCARIKVESQIAGSRTPGSSEPPDVPILPRLPHHLLSMKQLWGNACWCDSLCLMEVVTFMLRCASDGDPNRNFSYLALLMVQLCHSSMLVQDRHPHRVYTCSKYCARKKEGCMSKKGISIFDNVLRQSQEQSQSLLYLWWVKILIHIFRWLPEEAWGSVASVVHQASQFRLSSMNASQSPERDKKKKYCHMTVTWNTKSNSYHWSNFLPGRLSPCLVRKSLVHRPQSAHLRLNPYLWKDEGFIHHCIRRHGPTSKYDL